MIQRRQITEFGAIPRVLSRLLLSKALFGEGSNVNAEVDPLVAFDKAVRHSHMHVAERNVLGAITEHYSSSGVLFVSDLNFQLERVKRANEYLQHQIWVQDWLNLFLLLLH